MPARDFLYRAQHWQRRTLAWLLLVLQVGVVLSPLAERAGRRTVTHAEQRGTRHAASHNEETCALCAVRSLQANIAAAPSPTRFRDVPRRIDVAFFGTVTSRDPPAANGTRAPPALS